MTRSDMNEPMIVVSCSRCKAIGKIGDNFFCAHCEGKGYVTVSEEPMIVTPMIVATPDKILPESTKEYCARLIRKEFDELTEGDLILGRHKTLIAHMRSIGCEDMAIEMETDLNI